MKEKELNYNFSDLLKYFPKREYKVYYRGFKYFGHRELDISDNFLEGSFMNQEKEYMSNDKYIEVMP